MILLNGSSIKKMFADETLFDKVSFSVDENDKIGFVGPNGAGKSTFFNILTGSVQIDGGELFQNKNTRLGYLEQYACVHPERTVMDEILSVFSDLIDMESELEEIRWDIEHQNGELDTLVAKQTVLSERFSDQGGFYYKSRASSTLRGLGFSEEEFQKKVEKLSGGQKTRLELGKILLSDTNLLLLDEPTNHLDIDSVEWLEEFLRAYQGAFIVISHDRYFLDRVTNKTFELDRGRFFSYNGNYSEYAKQKEIDQKTQKRQYENTKKEIGRLEKVVEQQRRWNRERNIKMAESKQKVIDKLEAGLEKPMDEPDEMEFHFQAKPGGGQDVIVTEELSKSFGNQTLFEHTNLHILKGEKVFLLGSNGCGKTTLLKILLGQLEQDRGTYKIGANIDVAYYDQAQEGLNPNKTVIDELWDDYPNLSQTQVRNALAVFLFRGDDVYKQIGMLSGGERARVLLAKLMLQRANLLIMDEPTNHLDIESREALERALAGYDGTMLMVSHDRYFINKLATRILHMEKGGVVSYEGGYDFYAERVKQSQSEAQADKLVQEKKLDYQEQKRIAAEKRKTLSRFAAVEKEIASMEDEIGNLESELEEPEIATDYVKAAEIMEMVNARKTELEQLYEQWEELQAVIEEKGYLE